jgi:hypothetical protein
VYHLRLFNVDARGQQNGIVHIGGPFDTATLAITEAYRLRLGTRFQITDCAGQLVMEDDLPSLSRADSA